tara:strand:+ start:3865 stop:4533 length:669 start_codon:yes stop_codon:yes gene_type:complete
LKVSAIILAAGSGSRFGEKKQFKQLKGVELYKYSLNKFLNCSLINEIVLAVPESRLADVKIEIESIKALKNILVVSGGPSRQVSVKNSVSAVSQHSDLVCIHDSARPFISEALIKQSINACLSNDGAIVAIPNYDTIKTCVSGYVEKTIDRNNTWMAQTPQVFWKTKLLKAIDFSEKNNAITTDESSMMESLDFQISVVKGNANNFKITFPEDWERASNLVI